jgi:hypothetical protein
MIPGHANRITDLQIKHIEYHQRAVHAPPDRHAQYRIIKESGDKR